MPNRIIKESIRDSKNVNALTDFQFRLWVYLITYVDDFGRGNADIDLIKGHVFPKRKGVTEKQIIEALTVLANTGMIVLYEVDGDSFFYFPKWEKHQQKRAAQSKYPSPAEGHLILDNIVCNQLISSDINCNQLQSDDINCNQMISDDIECSRNRIRNRNSNRETKSDSTPAPAQARESDFERFWKAYPRHEKKKDAEKAFDKALKNHPEMTVDDLIVAVETQKSRGSGRRTAADTFRIRQHGSTVSNGATR